MTTDKPTEGPTDSFHGEGEGGDASKPLWEAKSASGPSLVGKTIGHYRIRRVIASGGMGTVYEAVQESPRRTVALKVMKHGVASKSALRRFEYESQILARLRHPGIAQVYEAGTHDDGSGAVPYFAMEYIPNAKPIAQYAHDKKLSTRQRLELFAKVCDAVYHGHQKGIIHRDLKPGNILVDAHGQPKVIDFGVARATDSDLAMTTLQTDIGQLIGTLQYMSPEQCDADPHDIDTRSDVYALGVVLYEMLCEQLPYDVTRVALHEAARVIRETPPTRPSSFNRTLRGDIETIALKALEKERDRRYRSADDLGVDIARYLKNEPIIARPPSVMYQARTFARRNKALVGGVAAVFIVLLAGIIGTSTFALRAEQQRLVAEQREQEAVDSRADALAAKAAEEAQRKLAEKQTEIAIEQRNIARWRSWLTTANAEFPDDAAMRAMILREADEDWRDPYAEARSLESSRGDFFGRVAALRGHEDEVYSASWSPDGSRIVTASEDGTARVWNADGAGEPIVLRGHEDEVYSASWSPDGARIVTASEDGTARVWNADGAGEPIVLRGHEANVRSASWSPDGARIVTASSDYTARVWTVDWPARRRQLWEQIPDLLAPHERVRYLGESEEEARATYERQKAERDARLRRQ